MPKYIIVLLTILTLLSCNNEINQAGKKFISEELELLTDKTTIASANIKFLAKRFPERYSQVKSHSTKIEKSIHLMDSLIEIKNKSQFKEEFKNLKSIISKSKYYRGSWIFDLMKFRFQYIDNPDFSSPLKLKWQISSLENDLQEYLNKSLNDNYTVFTDVRPIVLNDSLIYMTSRDSNIHQEIHIWDISKSEKLFYENPKDNSIKKVKMINGIGKLTNKQVTEFPNGYQGFFKVETKRGDGNSYWFSNK